MIFLQQPQNTNYTVFVCLAIFKSFLLPSVLSSWTKKKITKKKKMFILRCITTQVQVKRGILTGASASFVCTMSATCQPLAFKKWKTCVCHFFECVAELLCQVTAHNRRAANPSDDISVNPRPSRQHQSQAHFISPCSDKVPGSGTCHNSARHSKSVCYYTGTGAEENGAGVKEREEMFECCDLSSSTWDRAEWFLVTVAKEISIS